MLRKIISGGQTGADQAALDSAIKFNIEHGGWVPKGRKTEQGVLLAKYKMDEMKTADYPARTQQNIMDSDATLIIASGNLTGGTLLTKNLAKKMNKPYCHIDYISMDDFEAAMLVHSFIVDNNVEILNVAGPRISSDAAIYEGARTILEALIYMAELASGDGIEKIEFISFNKEEEIIPDNMDDLVKLLSSKLTLKTKTKIATLHESKISSLYFELSDYIMDKYIFKPGNTILFKQYVKEKSKELCNTSVFFEPESMIKAGDFTMEIVKTLKKFLEQDHVLRIVK
ncbi:MAG: putative molybdenum carrier protein [Desulfobacteraceae bacterium]|nr:putative molybdenum carrier protein [Desulfobacteraceae bacterium]